MSFNSHFEPYPGPVNQYIPDIVSVTLPFDRLTETQLVEIHTAQDLE